MAVLDFIPESTAPHTVANPTVSFMPMFKEVCSYLDRKKQEMETGIIPRSMSQEIIQSMQGVGSSGADRDRELLQTLRWFDENGHPRSMQQREFHSHFRRGCMSIIYGKEFPQMEEKLLRDNGWVDMKKTVIIETPRRFGKTYSTAMYAISLAVTQPNLRCCIYSTGQTTATQVLTYVRQFFRSLPSHSKFTIVMDNQTELRFHPSNDSTDVRFIKSYTSNQNMSTPFPPVCFCICDCGSGNKPRFLSAWVEAWTHPPFKSEVQILFPK